MPYYPSDDTAVYTPATLADKRVAEYADISIFNVGNICFYDYLLLLRDAVIYGNIGSQEGREYLEKCYNLANTEPDREKLREKFGKKQ